MEQQTYYQPTATEAIQHQVEMIDEEEIPLKMPNYLNKFRIERPSGKIKDPPGRNRKQIHS